MCAEKGRPGRPRIYESAAEKKRAERARIKAAGCRELRISLPGEYKALLERFCGDNNMSQVEGLCYLLDLYYDFSDSMDRKTFEHALKEEGWDNDLEQGAAFGPEPGIDAPADQERAHKSKK